MTNKKQQNSDFTLPNESENKQPNQNVGLQITPELLQQLAMNQESQDDETDLAELWNAIWAGKLKIIAVTAVFAIASVFYALSLPNIYKAEALLAPATEESGGMAGLAAKFGGLASLAGVNLDGGGTSIMIFENEIISSPSGDSERSVSDIIYFR